ncbi:MAG: HAD family phosphatase, partial [Chloroflexi bacterium]
KPDPRFYRLALERLGVEPEEAVFVDDLPENVQGAQEVRIQAFVHEDSRRTIAQLEEMLNSG